MDILTPAHKALLLDLLNAGVEYMLVGGYAVNFHGYPRYTVDLDIWLKPDNDNRQKFATFLEQNGFDEESIKHILHLDFTKAHSFHIGQDEKRVDFLTHISGVAYADADKRKAFLSISEKRIPVIHYNDLITNKMMGGRLQDRADVDELQKINRFRKK